jgi:hypothetical protein
MAEETNLVSGASSASNAATEATQSNQVSASNSSAQPAQDQQPQQQADGTKPVSEKMLSQSEVDKLVGKLKHESYEKGIRDAQLKASADNLAAQQVSQHYKQQDPHQADNAQQRQQQNDLPQDAEKIRQLIRDESEKQTQLALAQRVATEFTQKLISAKESNKYADFEEKITQLNLPNIPHIVGWANSLDNTADVLYDIAKDPVKFANVLMLSQTAPHLAVAQLQKLSNSIKENETAAKQPIAAEPLSQLKPSTTGTNTGSMSVKELRKQSWLRG